MADFGWHYPPGVTGREPQISGIYPADATVDECLDILKSAEDLIEEVYGILDDQGMNLPEKTYENFDRALQHLKDEIEWKRPHEYDPMDERI